MNKEENKSVVSVIDIPKNHVKPVNARIFAVEQDPGEMKTVGGIIIPTDYQAPEAKNVVTRRLRRYYVVDAADDCLVPVKRGDEIYPFIPQEAEEWVFPVVIDWFSGKVYTVFHETELAGYSRQDIKKEGE